MQSFCCCSKLNVVARLLRLSFTCVPEIDFAQRGLNHLIAARGASFAPATVDLGAKEHILVDRNWHGIGPLEDHSHRAAQLRDRDIGVVNVFIKNDHVAFVRDVAVALVDCVEAAEQGGFAAT